MKRKKTPSKPKSPEFGPFTEAQAVLVAERIEEMYGIARQIEDAARKLERLKSGQRAGN